MVLGNRAYLNGLNIVGMKRRGFDRGTRSTHLSNRLPRSCSRPEGAFAERLERGQQAVCRTQPRVMEVLEFIRDRPITGRSVMPQSQPARLTTACPPACRPKLAVLAGRGRAAGGR